MDQTRYVSLPVCVLDKKIYPIHKVEWVEDDYFGNHYEIKGEYIKPEFTTATFDLKTKKFVENVFVDVYPEFPLTVGKTYYRKKVYFSGNTLIKDVLKEIKFYDYKVSYQKYNEQTYESVLNALTEEQKSMLRPGNLIEVRSWKEKFIFESGHETISKYDIFEVEE